MTTPQNTYMTTPRSQGIPIYSNSTEAQSNAGNTLSQNPASGRATHGQHTSLQHPAGLPGLQTQSGMAQHAQGPGNPQSLPGYPPNPSGYTYNQPNVSPPFSTFDSKKFIDKETKTLGAIQMLIGLIHIFSVINSHLRLYSCHIVWYSGYLVWGGIAFFVSGSLSVWTAKDSSPCVVSANIVANVISAICSLMGICIIISDLICGSFAMPNIITVTATVFPFSLLELILTFTISFFGIQTVFCKQTLNTRAGPSTVNVYPASTVTIPASVATGPASVSSHQTLSTNPPPNLPHRSSTPLNVPDEPIYSAVADS